MGLAEPAAVKSAKELADTDSQGDSTPKASIASTPDLDDKKSGKGKKRALFGFGKKKSSASLTPESSQDDARGATIVSKDPPQLATPSVIQTTQGSGSLGHSIVMPPSSPIRTMSTSPRVSSPARSQIFERDVQDSSIIQPNSPAIPTHIQTENHIPPVLDDASEAITNRKLDPDTVEIVTHSSHQPASVTVTGAGAGPATPYDPTSSEWADELASFADRVGLSSETASNYGSLDASDVRRLSFISFADVVQSEHLPTAGSPIRDNLHMAGLTSLPSAAMNRSPSPLRSPVSSQGFGTSPPTSNPGSIKGLDMSPPRKVGSPGS
ncbi:hypothetical protein Golomagni_07625, partial [Golovinomyces magnicellulatus]